jgi:hypothetical protein
VRGEEILPGPAVYSPVRRKVRPGPERAGGLARQPDQDDRGNLQVSPRAAQATAEMTTGSSDNRRSSSTCGSIVLGKRRVEGSVRVGERLGGSLPDVHGREAATHRGHERFGWVDGGHVLWPETFGELAGERTGATPDVEDALACVYIREIRELAGNQP